MADVSLVIKSKNVGGDKTSTTTVTNVNPDATNQQLYTLGQKFYSFMTTVDPIITRQTSEVLTGSD